MTSTAASGHDVQPSREARTPRWAYVVALLLVAFGMAARVRHYALDMSFWWDEAMLADNLVRRDAGEMLEPLDNRQAAPAGFLLLTKTVGSTFGYDARTLRSVPFAASLAGLLLFGPLAWRVLGWRWALPALALLAVNMHQIGHAAELKQYSGDSALAIGLLVIAAGIHRHGWHPRLAVGLAGLGAAAVWFSHPAVFVLAAIGSALFLVTRHELPPGKRREHLRWLALISVAWCVSFGLHFWFFVRPVAANSDLRTWWHFAFWPIVPRSGQHLMWYRDIPIRMFRYPGGISMLGLGALTFLAGCVGFFRRDRAMLVLLAGPLALALLASALGQYPFFERMLMFATAPMILLIVAGARLLARSTRSRVVAVGAVLLLLAGPAYRAAEGLVLPQGKGRADVMPTLKHIAANWQTGDALYPHWGLHFTVQYYVRYTGILPDEAKLVPEGRTVVTMPGSDPGWTEQLTDILPTLRGRYDRVWVIYGNLASGEPHAVAGLRLIETFSHRRGACAKLYEVLQEPAR